MARAVAVIAIIAYSGAASFVLMKLAEFTVGPRVEKDAEREGLDIALRGESVI